MPADEAHPLVSIVVPAFNVARTIEDTICSLLLQSFSNFELIIVDDGSTDATLDVVHGFKDARIRLVRQSNLGLAGARNTGIAESRGNFIGFCDADDLWEPEKLAAHVSHLHRRPDVGISFSGSRMIGNDGEDMGLSQRPKLQGITARDVLLRNPIGNGSSAVIRRTALDDIAYRPEGETSRDWWFDETFRQTEDVEAWLRLSLTTSWKIEGVPGLLTRYRINPTGLSGNIERQLASWNLMYEKIKCIAPSFIARHGEAARAYQLRYLCRRAVGLRDGSLAMQLARGSLNASLRPVAAEPIKSITTFLAAALLATAGSRAYQRTEMALLAARRRFT